MTARTNERLKTMAPLECFFLDEVTTDPNACNWTNKKSWLALV
jgi:hypothetical protein